MIRPRRNPWLGFATAGAGGAKASNGSGIESAAVAGVGSGAGCRSGVAAGGSGSGVTAGSTENATGGLAAAGRRVIRFLVRVRNGEGRAGSSSRLSAEPISCSAVPNSPAAWIESEMLPSLWYTLSTKITSRVVGQYLILAASSCWVSRSNWLACVPSRM